MCTYTRAVGQIRAFVFVAVLPVIVLLTSVPAYADDAVMEWNQIALAATTTAGQGPVPQIRTMAIVQVAMHDAVNAITGEYRTYLPVRWSWGSPEAAAIAAAHRTLVGLLPAAQAPALDQARAASLKARGLSDKSAGIALGEAVASAILALRANDGSAQAQFPYTAPGAGTPGVWVSVGPAAPVTPGWGKVRPWIVRQLYPFQPDGPPPLHSRTYARDYNEVKDVGALVSPSRTDEQTNIARFWLAPPSIIWNRIARQTIQAQKLDLSATARTFALLYLAAADASIVCWDAKYTNNFWRPITAIQHGDEDDNEGTEADPTWAPLITTPQHPDYLSGHSTNSGAMAMVLILLFGDKSDTPIVATSPTNPGFERHWASFTEGVEEVMDARVYSGIHFRSANEDGAKAGRKVARYVVSHALRDRSH